MPSKDAQAIINRRQFLGWTRADLAQGMNVSESIIAGWEDGTMALDKTTMRELAYVMGTTVANLYNLPRKKTTQTPHQIKERIYAYVLDYFQDHAHYPTYRQIAAHCDLASTSTIAKYMSLLEDEGKIKVMFAASYHLTNVRVYVEVVA